MLKRFRKLARCVDLSNVATPSRLKSAASLLSCTMAYHLSDAVTEIPAKFIEISVTLTETSVKLTATSVKFKEVAVKVTEISGRL